MDAPDNPYEAPRAALLERDEGVEDWAVLGIPERVAGYLIDVAILIGVGTLLAGTELGRLINVGFAIFDKVSLPLWLSYYVGFLGLYGATPGKMVFGARVVNVWTGRKLSRWRIALRSVVAPFAGTIVFGYLWALFNINNRTCHDYVSGAVVVIWDKARDAPERGPEAPVGARHRCSACGHQAWLTDDAASEPCHGCGRPGTYQSTDR